MNITQRILCTAISMLSLASCATTTASVSPAPALSLERIYQHKEFKAETAPYFRWLDDGSGYTVLEPRDKAKKAEAKTINHVKNGVEM